LKISSLLEPDAAKTDVRSLPAKKRTKSGRRQYTGLRRGCYRLAIIVCFAHRPFSPVAGVSPEMSYCVSTRAQDATLNGIEPGDDVVADVSIELTTLRPLWMRLHAVLAWHFVYRVSQRNPDVPQTATTTEPLGYLTFSALEIAGSRS